VIASDGKNHDMFPKRGKKKGSCELPLARSLLVRSLMSNFLIKMAK
jgi:hypothetical protein